MHAPSTRQASPSLATICRDVSFPRVEVEVLGCCLSDVEKAKKLLDDLVMSELKPIEIPAPHLHLLLEADKLDIVANSQSLQVCITVMASDTVILSGKSDDTLDIARQIEKYLQNAKDRVSRQEEEKRLRKTLRWEVSNGERWTELDQSVSLDLENNLQRKVKSFSYTWQQQTYVVNLDNREQKDGLGNITKLKRTLMADSETGTVVCIIHFCQNKVGIIVTNKFISLSFADKLVFNAVSVLVALINTSGSCMEMG